MLLKLPGLPQQFQASQEQPPVFRAERAEVEVVVIVRDGNGRPVANLQQNDFEIRDDGKPQKITSFYSLDVRPGSGVESSAGTPPSASSGAEPPAQRRFLALFFDDENTEGRSGPSASADLERAKGAAEEFVRSRLQPKDRVAILKTSDNHDITFSNDKPKVLSEIAALRMHDEGYHGESDLCPYVSPYEGYAIADNLDPLALQQVAERARDCMCPPGAECSLTQFFSVARSAAVTTWQSERNVTQHLFAGLEVAVHALQEMPGARMLLLTSRGFFAQRTDPVVNRITDSALRAHVVISSLSTKGLGAAMTRGQYAVQQQAENQTMVAFAESTGGRFIKNNNDLLSSLESLATPETAYVLTFSPDPAKNDGKFHRLRVEVRASGHFTVSAREGYFALRAPPR